MTRLLRTPLQELRRARPGELDAETEATARHILEDVRAHGDRALRAQAERLGDLEAGAPLLLSREDLAERARRVPEEDLALLERTAERIRRFASAQAAL